MATGAESTALKKVQKYWKRSYDVQEKRNRIYERIWQRYKGFNPDVTDIYRSNLVMPTLYAAAETVAPRVAKAIFGKRPYIPIRSEKNPDAVKPIELALDTLLYWAGFKATGGQTIKSIFNFGTAFWEAIPYRKIVTEKRIIPSPYYPWQPVEVEEKIPRFRLDVRSYMPWQVYVEPHMVNLDSPGYAIILEIVPKSEIERLIDAGRYKNIDKDRLSSEGDKEDKQFSEYMMKSIGIDRPDEDLDYGVLMRLQSKDEYITAWNGTLILAEEGNPYNHKSINATRCAWNLDPMLQNSFWGQPEAKAMEGVLDKYDESLNQIFDNGAVMTQAVLGFKPEYVDANKLVWVGGARIPIKNNAPGPIRESVDVLETKGLPPDAYKMPALMKGEIDRGMGVQAPDYGEPTRGEQTATEMSLLASRGDMRNEHRTEMLEALGLTDLADKCTSHMEQFMSMDDLAEIVGPEMAMQVATLNPYNVPGGFDYQFKGSDSYINDYQKRADLRAVLEVVQNNPASKPPGVARIAWETYGFSQQQINDLVMADEEFYGMMAQQQQAEDEARVKDVIGDVIRAEAGAAAKAKHETKKEPAKRPGSAKKHKPAQTPTQGNPRGGRA